MIILRITNFSYIPMYYKTGTEREVVITRNVLESVNKGVEVDL